MTRLTTFTYNSELYIRVIPGKQLFRSTMVHEVVNRGDVFAIRVRDSALTIIPGTASVIHSESEILPLELSPEIQASAKTRPPNASESEKLDELKAKFRAQIARKSQKELL